jgi:hypothetical protein
MKLLPLACWLKYNTAFRSLIARFSGRSERHNSAAPREPGRLDANQKLPGTKNIGPAVGRQTLANPGA